MRAAVLGRPVAHSLSPTLHRAAYAELGLTGWRYDAIDCGEDELAALVAERRSGWAGFSCTMPLKRVALQVAVEVDPLAEAVGSANTLLPARGGGWWATTTDVAGILAALAEQHVDPRSVTVLGAGGTAQAALGAMAELGLGEVAVLARDLGRSAELRAAAARLEVEVSLAELVPEAVALSADLVISTLPAGAADPLAGRRWQAGQALLDVSYHPWPSVLAVAVEQAGGVVVSGALMLLHQAAAQVELMTGQRAPLAAMRAALAGAAPRCGV